MDAQLSVQYQWTLSCASSVLRKMSTHHYTPCCLPLHAQLRVGTPHMTPSYMWYVGYGPEYGHQDVDDPILHLFVTWYSIRCPRYAQLSVSKLKGYGNQSLYPGPPIHTPSPWDNMARV